MKTKPDKVGKAAEQEYYHQANQWESEMYRSARGRARVWAWIAGISSMLTALSVTALMLVMPLKQTVPYVIEVDRVSGITEVKRAITDGGVSESEAITKYFIVDYLNAREAYMYDRADIDYTKVQKMSASGIGSAYHDEFQPSNDKSPLNVLGRSGIAEIEIRNVSFINSDTVTVPIKRTEKIKGQQTETYEVVTLSYQYMQDPLSEEDRFINPLGFQVTAYRKDAQLIEAAQR